MRMIVIFMQRRQADAGGFEVVARGGPKSCWCDLSVLLSVKTDMCSVSLNISACGKQ